MRDLSAAYQALEKVAEMEGISVETVVGNIEEAIAAAIKTSKERHDQQTLERWAQIPCSGDVPDAFELVAYLGEKLYQEQSGIVGEIVT